MWQQNKCLFICGFTIAALIVIGIIFAVVTLFVVPSFPSLQIHGAIVKPASTINNNGNSNDNNKSNNNTINTSGITNINSVSNNSGNNIINSTNANTVTNDVNDVNRNSDLISFRKFDDILKYAGNGIPIFGFN